MKKLTANLLLVTIFFSIGLASITKVQADTPLNIAKSTTLQVDDLALGMVNYSKISVMSSTSWKSKRIAYIPIDTEVVIERKVKSGKTTWYQVTVSMKDKVVTGYCLAKYITKTEITKDTGIVDRSKISVMSKCSWSSTRYGYIPKDTEILILSSVMTKVWHWYKIITKLNDHYIIGYTTDKYIIDTPESDRCLDYTEPVYDRPSLDLDAGPDENGNYPTIVPGSRPTLVPVEP